MDSKDLGLFDKYLVYKAVGDPENETGGWEPVEDWVFVLNPKNDPSARFALLAYAVAAENEGHYQLADDIRVKIGAKRKRLKYEPSEG